MSGGAGYSISKSLYAHITEYIRKIGKDEAYSPLFHLKEKFCDDLCVGIWIQAIARKHKVNQLNNDLFHLAEHENVNQLKDAITFHKVLTKEQYDFYTDVSDHDLVLKEKTEKTEKNNSLILETAFVLISDLLYFNKAKRTIIDLRSKGNWRGDIVLITIDFNLNNNFKDFYGIIEAKFDKIDKTNLLSKIGANGFSNSDKREITKLNQWEKLHVFDDYFTNWKRVVFLDAGLRVLDDVKYLLKLDYKNKLLAPKDGKYYENLTFNCQLSYDNKEVIKKVKNDFGENILNETYFLNCIWIYDTKLLSLCNKNDLIEAMNEYTLCRTNEMGIMNLLFTFKYHVWEPFPFLNGNGKILFDWCELNNPNTNWTDYCYIKYPVTISFDDC